VRLGRRIRQLRLERGFSQEALAAEASLDPKHLQSVEGGKTNITVASLVGLKRALKVTLSELFEGV